MKYLIIIIVYNLIAIISQASSVIDSLINISTKSNVDSVKSNLFYEIGYYYLGKNHDSTLYFTNQSVNYSQKLNDKMKVADAFAQIGISYYYTNNFDSAMLFWNKALPIYKQINDYKGISSIYGNYALVDNVKGNYDNALINYFKTKEIYENLKDTLGLSRCYINLGLSYWRKTEFDKSMNCFEKSIQLKKLVKDTIGIPKVMMNIGLIYSYKADYSKAIGYFIDALKIAEKNQDKKTTSNCCLNIANLYIDNNDIDKSEEYCNNAITLFKEIPDNYGLSYAYGLLAKIYNSRKEYDLALKIYDEAIKIQKSIGDVVGEMKCNVNKGLILIEIGQIDKALEILFDAKKIAMTLGDNTEIAISFNSIASALSKANRLNEAITFAKSAVEIATEYKLHSELLKAYDILSSSYEQIGDNKNALYYLKQFNIYSDTIFNIEKNNAILDIETKYQSEKKQLQIENLKKDNKLKENQNQKQKILIYSFVLGFIIILIFSILLYNQFKAKKKANILLAIQNTEINQKNEEITSQRDEISAQRDLVTHQKEEIEHIHLELTDSINYAKRIQEAVLPISTESRNIMGEHFVLFRPKDIVSGDFYWTAKVENTLIVAVADCTGHGVPGAFMSMLGISFLNEIIRKKEIIAANQVLNELRKEIINALQQKGQLGEQKDGMDISLIAIRQLSKSSELLESSELYQAQWAGANNPLWLVRSSKNLTGFENMSGLEEVKPDKMPIAIYEKMDSFTNHEIQLNSGDCIYLMSDGYEDQFGGPKGKKFLSKNLKQLLLDNSQLPMNEQKEMLEKTIIDWIGEGEQIDDITVLGIKI